MMIPHGVHTTKPNQVYKLIKFVYGFKEASGRWHEILTQFLIKHHYTKVGSDHSLFIKANSSSFNM